MKNRIILSLVSFILIGLYGCEKVIDFQASAYNPKLVIYGALFADSTPGLMIGRTQSYYGWEEYSISKLYVEGADVKLISGQEESTLELGRYETNLFNILVGQPPEDQRFGYSPRNTIADSNLRLYESPQALQAGNWYTLTAAHEDDQISREVYIPYRAQNVSVILTTRDTSFTNEYGRGERQEIQETVYEVEVSFDIQDNQSVWTKPLLSIKSWEFGYSEYDPVTNTYNYIEDSIELTNYFGSGFSPESAGRISQRVWLGSVQSGTYYYSNGESYSYTDQPNFYYLSSLDYGKLIEGDTVAIPLDVSVLLSHAQNETASFYSGLFQQLYSQGDPLSEPVIVNLDEAEGVGIIGGFSRTEVETVMLKLSL